MTAVFANIAKTIASIFINLPNLPDKIICVYFLITIPVIETLLNFIWKKIVFNKPILPHLCFVFHCTFTFHHGPPRFHD